MSTPQQKPDVKEAYEPVVISWSMELLWDAYLEDGKGPDPLGFPCSKRTEAHTVALMSNWNRLARHNEALSTSLLKRTKGSPHLGVSFSQNITGEEGKA
jgi:hypothetical protein